jgi:DNA-binding transcriptional LysR family regulator
MDNDAMQINLNQLRAFYFAAREKSVTKAAEILYVTQPAVTMQIKALEEALGLKLFKKYGKLLELTEVGTVLFDYGKKVFDTVEQMEYALKGYMELAQGSLTIGTTRSFARHLMPGLISRFQEEFPGVKISLKEGSSQEIANDLVEFKYDLGIIGRLPDLRKLKVIPYTKEEFRLVTSPQHRFTKEGEISYEDLKSEPIIIREKGSGSRHAILSLLRAKGLKPSVIVEAGSVEFIKEYVMRGRGISFLYKPEIQIEAEMGLLKSLQMKEGPIFVQTDIIFILPRDTEPSPPTQAFLRLAEQKS